MATDCATALNLTAANPGSFNDTETALDAAATAAKTAWDIADIGYTLLLSDGSYIPVLGFVSLALDVATIVGMFSGRPQMEDTNNVIWAYNMSAYWPLHALATDLKIAEKNGAPISDSNPAIQAQFSAWKQGTIISIQQVAGWQGGPSDPGYWQLQRLINYSWSQSGGGQQAVLNVVRVIDRFTQILACLKQQQTTIPPPGPPPPGPPPPPPPPEATGCDSGNIDQDEILDFCQATQTNLQRIIAAIQALNRPAGGGGLDPCCLAVVNAIGNVTEQLTNITALLVGGGTGEPSVDLTPLVAELAKLGAAVAQYPPALTACCAQLSTGLDNIASTISSATGTNVANIVAELKRYIDTDLLPSAMVDELVKLHAISPTVAQYFSDRPSHWSITGALGAIAAALFGAPNMAEVRQAAIATTSVITGAFTTTFTTDNLLTGALQSLVIVGVLVGSLVKTVLPALKVVGDDLIQAIGTALVTVDPATFGGRTITTGSPAEWALEYVRLGTPPKMVIDTTNYQLIINDAFSRAATMGFSSWILAMLGGMLMGPFEKSFEFMAAMVKEAAGFAEITQRVLGPYFDATIYNRAVQDANQSWPTRVPPVGQALTLWARRKITDPQRDTLLGYAGVDPVWRDAAEQGAFRPLQPRTLVQAFLDQPINRAQLVDMLRDTAMAETNVQIMADAIIYKSIANVRNSYLSALISGYGKGIISDQELSDALTQFNFSTQAKQYVTAHVLILRREALASEAEKTIVPLVANGNITPQQGLANLQAAGIQPWYATLQIDLATTRATIHGIHLQAEAARKLALAREHEAQRAAVEQFEVGNLNAAGLSAALLVAGIDPLIASMVVSVEAAKQQGRMQVVFNQLLPPLQAKVLREQVAAIEQQTKDQLITLAQAAAQLGALGLDPAEVEALVARWAAMLKKTPGAAVYQTP